MNYQLAMARLLQLRMYGPVHPDTGICDNVDVRGLRKFMAEWPEYSGNSSYPVPHPDGADNAYGRPGMWNRRTKYGRARWRLVDYLIDRLKEHV